MSDNYLGQILLTGFTFAPKGFAMCNGQLMSIQQNAALFSLLGTYYGGNGVQTFGLPDLRGRVPVGTALVQSAPWQPSIGEVSGIEQVTLLNSNMPQHSHLASGSSQNSLAKNPAGTIYGTQTKENIFGNASNLVALSPGDVVTAGSNQPHNNMQPFLTVNFVICLSGIYPSRS